MGEPRSWRPRTWRPGPVAPCAPPASGGVGDGPARGVESTRLAVRIGHEAELDLAPTSSQGMLATPSSHVRTGILIAREAIAAGV
jgi:hypothetical protein